MEGGGRGRPEARAERPLRRRGANLTNESRAALVDHVTNQD